MKTRSFEQQYIYAQHIKETKIKDWLELAKKYVPEYLADHLFNPKSGHASEMLTPHPEYGFIYNPETLVAGIEVIMRILIRKDYGSATPELISHMYCSFEDPETRIAYLLPFFHGLHLYSAIGLQVIEDLKAISPMLTSQENIEINNNHISHIETMLGIKKDHRPKEINQSE